MNLERYGLHQAPFGGRGPAAFAPVISRSAPADALERVLRDGDGIALLTAASGMGKTTLCRELERRLAPDFLVVLLHDAGYTSRRSLLQAILYELGLPYTGLTETEARLRLLETIRNHQANRSGLVLLADEAQHLNDRLLEELRSLINQEAEGRHLVRLLLCGDLTLEERLISPSLTGVNQRVVGHETLAPLSHEESAQLIDHRLMQAGSDGWEHVFTRAAMELLCLVCDGSPRNLEQLAHRSLQLAAARRTPRIAVDAVRAALEELRELPLQWNEPSNLESYAARDRDEDDAPPEAEPGDDTLLEHDETGDAIAVRTGDELTVSAWESTSSFAIEIGGDAPEMIVSPAAAEGSVSSRAGIVRPAPASEVLNQLRSAKLSEPSLDPLFTRGSADEHVLFDDFSATLADTAVLHRGSRHPSPSVGNATPAAWTELDIADPYAALDAAAPERFVLPACRESSDEPQTLGIMPPNAAEAHDSGASVFEFEEDLLENVREIARHVATAVGPAATNVPEPDFDDRTSTLESSPWCSGFSAMPEWDVVQPEWVAEQPFTPFEIDTSHRLELLPLPIAAPVTTERPTIEVLAVTAITPCDSTAAGTSADCVEPNTATVAVCCEPTVELSADAPPSQHRVDDAGQRPYSQLFTRLRRLRTTFRQRASAQE